MSALQTSLAQTPDGETAMLETFGAVSGILVYNTYIVIGTMADSYEGEVYDSTDVTSYLGEQTGAMQNLADQYILLRDSGFLKDTADQVFVGALIEACHLLDAEATALLDYVATPTTENATIFQEYRSRAWAKIADILGLD